MPLHDGAAARGATTSTGSKRATHLLGGLARSCSAARTGGTGVGAEAGQCSETVDAGVELL